MTSEQWNQLTAKAESGDSEAQWQVGAWLEDGLADSNGGVRRPSRCTRCCVAGIARARLPEILLGRLIWVFASATDEACDAMTWKVFAGSSVRFTRMTPLLPTILPASTEIAETISAQCSGIDAQSPAAMAMHSLKLGVDATQASAPSAIHSRRSAAFVRQSPAKTSRRPGVMRRCSALASHFMKGEVYESPMRRQSSGLLGRITNDDHAEARSLIKSIASGRRAELHLA